MCREWGVGPISPALGSCDPVAEPCQLMNLVLVETVLLPLADSTSGEKRGPSLRAEPLHHEVRLRRELSPPSGRTWWLDVAVFVPVFDPEQVLLECEDFLVDSTDNEPVGVVDSVETDEETGYVSALEVAAGWSGRRRFRVAVDEIELVVPAHERIVIRVPAGGTREPERPLS